MRNVFLGTVLASFIFFEMQYFSFKKEEKEQLIASTALIQQQIKNVGKLIVIEGNFSPIKILKSFISMFFLQIKKPS